MGDSRFPLIRGGRFKTDFYQSPKGGGGGALPLPPRDPKGHRDALLTQLDAALGELRQRPAGPRDPEAARELFTVEPTAGFDLAPSPLGKGEDVRVLGVTETGSVLLDSNDPSLSHLRQKIEAFADDEKTTAKGARKNAPAIAPIEVIRLSSEADLIGPRLRQSQLEPSAKRWFEVACRGGARSMSDAAASRRQVHRQLASLGLPVPQEFIATEQIVFFCRMSLAQIRTLVLRVDCVQELDLAPPDVRDWLLFNDQPVRDVRDFKLQPPAPNAPSVVILDTGIASKHPLLSAAVLRASSVVPNDTSPEDRHGHGTQMAGVALYADDVGAALDAGTAIASHWLHSVRLLGAPQVGTAAAEYRAFWPQLTVDAVTSAESDDPVRERPRVFGLATSYGIDLIEPTYWSHAIDRLAYNEGLGRLFCIAMGNADTGNLDLLTGYPSLNLTQKAQEPAQSANAVTVGAFTAKTSMPPETIYASHTAVAPLGGISPHSTSGVVGGSYGPDLLMEGGNVAFDGDLPDPFVETLTTLTTGRDLLMRPLSRLCMTSEAAARAYNLAATIWNVEPDLRPATVRGLMVHASDWTAAIIEQFKNLDERIAIAGLGVPEPSFAVACAADRATVLFEDDMPNAVAVEQAKARPPRTARGSPTETRLKRVVKFFRLPIPEDVLLGDPDHQVELRVTLSYLPEPNTFRRQVSHGLDLTWDMQGPAETFKAFEKRVNKLAREPAGMKAPGAKSFKWALGINRRSRGTVQSDRWTGPASWLAGEKHIAVVPVLGWWERRNALRELTMPFSLVVTVRAAGLDIYDQIRSAVENTVEVTT